MTTSDPSAALDPNAAVHRVDELLAQSEPWTPECVAELTRLVTAVPGRQSPVARRLRRLAHSASLGLLLDLEPDVPAVVESAHHLFGLGVARRFGSGRIAPLGLSLELWPSRSRQARALTDRAGHVFGVDLCALDVRGVRVLRGTMLEGNRRLETVATDLEWLTSASLRLQKTVVWLDGWRFHAKSLHGPSVAVHYVRRVLDRMRRVA